ncbi:MAG: hypothetical protein K2H32_06995 [Muribaculaceae bacterium]|nr:hypothetical protein [Muribaculaceae bacterium]MDE5858085.1 hypothetical protein [Muribaculaceae bacterium]
MKKILQLLPVVALMLMASACDSHSKLAKDINGTWASTPERLTDNIGNSSSIIRILEFDKLPEKNGGTLIMSGLISVNSAVPQGDAVDSPISYTASGVATISGEWTVQDDDEITIYLDPSTMKIDVDPEGVVLDYNVLTASSAPDTTAIKPALASMVKKAISTGVETKFFNAKKIDDIKIKDNIMSCEIDDYDITLHRQNVD